MTTIYLAVGASANQMRSALQREPAPAMLCSYLYYHVLKKLFGEALYREWVLDSGAFSAFEVGKVIDLGEYIDFCHKALASDHPPSEIYALDVVGDWRASQRNTEAMWKRGLKAIPCYHVGEPEDVLLDMAQSYPKIAIGGVAGMGKRAVPVLDQCFARVWPKRIHCFGMVTEPVLMRFPFHSVDSTSWSIAVRFGNWAAYGQRKMPIRGTYHLRPQVDHFLKLESRVQAKWSRALAELE